MVCPDDATAEVLFEGPGDPASCAACSCNDSALGCSSPTVACWYNSSDCSGMASGVFMPNSCANIPSCNGSCSNDQRCQQIGGSQVTGQCAPSGGTATIGPTWKGETTVCPSVTQGGGCASGEVCVPVAPMGFETDLCVRRDGDQGCPMGYPNGTLLYADGTDTRGCSACGCNEAGVSCSAGSSAIHDGSACSQSSITLAGCTDVTAQLDGPGASVAVTPGSLSGSCVPTGGEPTGSVMPTGPVTVCCP